MRIIEEIKLSKDFFQQIKVAPNALVLSIVTTLDGLTLYLEHDETEEPTDDFGIYLVPTNSYELDNVPENYMYFDTVMLYDNFKVSALHIYLEFAQAIDEEQESAD